MNVKLRSVLLSVFFVASLMGCGPSEKERMNIAALTTDIQPHCVGRVLIDAPQGFDIAGVSANSNRFMPPDMDFQEAPEMKLEIRAKGQTEQQFAKAVEQVIAKNSVPVQYQNDFALLAFTEKIAPNKILIRLYNKLGKVSGYYATEIHFWLNGFHVIASAESYEGKFASTEKHLKEFVRNIKIYEPTKSDKGFCIGPLLVQGRYSREEMSSGFRSKK